MITTSRNIALIVYFTKDWRKEWGGLLVDLEAEGGPRTYVPQVHAFMRSLVGIQDRTQHKHDGACWLRIECCQWPGVER